MPGVVRDEAPLLVGAPESNLMESETMKSTSLTSELGPSRGRETHPLRANLSGDEAAPERLPFPVGGCVSALVWGAVLGGLYYTVT